MKLDRFNEVSQQIVGVSQVPIGPPLSSTVPKFFDQTQVHPADTSTHQFSISV